MNRVEKFILGMLVLVATGTFGTLWNAFVSPPRIYAEMTDALRDEVQQAMKEAVRNK